MHVQKCTTTVVSAPTDRVRASAASLLSVPTADTLVYRREQLEARPVPASLCQMGWACKPGRDQVVFSSTQVEFATELFDRDPPLSGAQAHAEFKKAFPDQVSERNVAFGQAAQKPVWQPESEKEGTGSCAVLPRARSGIGASELGGRI